MEKEDSAKIFKSLMSSIERMQSDLLMVFEKKQKDIERQAEVFVKALRQEIAELKQSDTELEKLLQSEDHLHLLQVSAFICSESMQHITSTALSMLKNFSSFLFQFSIGLRNIIHPCIHQ